MHSIKSNVQRGQVKLRTHLLCIIFSFGGTMHCNIEEECHTTHKENAFGCDTACSDIFYYRKYVSESVAMSNFLIGYFQEQKHLDGQWHNLESKLSSKVSKSLVAKNPIARLFLDGEYQAITSMHSPYRHHCNWKRLANTSFYL